MRSVARRDRLAQVAETLARAVSHRSADAAIGVRFLENDVELLINAAPPQHVISELLLGFDAPATWDAFGLVAAAHAWDLDGDGRRRRIHLVHLQARGGPSHTLLVDGSGASTLLRDGAEGRMADACRRALGLPNPPPSSSPLQWWATLWLHLLGSTPALESLHHEQELVELFPGGKPFGSERSLQALRRHGELLAETCPWSTLRAAAASAALEVPGISPEVAAWMDDGLFARWSLAELGDPSAALAEVVPRLALPLADGLCGLLAAWEVPGRVPPGG